uniref:Uncharacterized protein n=1 Tax=Oryza sativa subsp. japonica TaxID=39947 RepID=Q5Z546_ORYSJ|nr:hypothetical protein [Oryza sativa Japonica Group]BAD62148.1 hypothetical protein [Oryza sativa Japonica Group]
MRKCWEWAPLQCGRPGVSDATLRRRFRQRRWAKATAVALPSPDLPAAALPRPDLPAATLPRLDPPAAALPAQIHRRQRRLENDSDSWRMRTGGRRRTGAISD